MSAAYKRGSRTARLKFALGATLAIWAGAGPARAQTTDQPTATLPAIPFAQAMDAIDAYEQRAGKIAQVMGSSLELRKFSRLQVDEHGKSAAVLTEALAAAQLPDPPTELSASQITTVKALYAVPARDFDRTYMADEVASHQQALEIAQAYAAKGDNSTLKAAAAAMVPAIQRDLDQAKTILDHVR
jgi:predicted outer membrane protein